jgi:hypothetical protein
MLHVGYTTRCALLPIFMLVRIRASIKFTLRPGAVGSRIGRKMASATPETARITTIPLVLEGLPPPRCRDCAQESQRIVEINSPTWAHVCSMGYAATRPNISRRC